MPPMKNYQVYSIGPDGSISGDRTIAAANDQDIVFEVRAMQRPLDTEIWDGDRRIAKVPAHRA